MAHKEIMVQDVTEGMTEAQRKEFLKFRSEMCETKAINRALRAAMHIKGTYTLQGLQKPFVAAPDFDPTICSECGTKCSNGVVRYSQEQFGRTLCMACQRKMGGNQ